MAGFRQCAACQAEYRDPKNRRFHAQPNACPACGPRVEIWNTDGWTLACGHDALVMAAKAVADGKIVAIKGVGGFQLLVDARNDEAVRELRRRKHRDEKPLAVMYPTLSTLTEDCFVSALEARVLESPQAPIVLLDRRQTGEIAPSIAPQSPTLGVMLPYSPLHHLLMAELGFPIVATSGNLSDEPICIDERDAVERLRGIADVFLVHDRPITRHIDDSVVRIVMGRELVLRRARGYAPLPVPLPPDLIREAEALPTVIAFGAHQKCAIAMSVGPQVIVSQHIGDLETSAAIQALKRVAVDLPRLYDLQPGIAACDMHPDYVSTRLAEDCRNNAGRRDFEHPSVVRIQHHYAHVLSCMADNELTGTVLGVAWDGTGYGVDGTIWGGEFLLVDDEANFQRVGHLRPFVLPGGERAVRQPRRTALAILSDIYGNDGFTMTDLAPIASFSPTERDVLAAMLLRKLNTPTTTSAGRLFDAVASLIGLCQRAGYEGQAAMLLEHAAYGYSTDEAYPIEVSHNGASYEIDWRPAVTQLVADIRRSRPVEKMAAMFHNALVEGIVDVAMRVGVERVALTGGCFQNKYLTERTVRRLTEAGLRPYWHQRIPPNDGGIALGQVIGAIRSRRCVSQSPDSSPASAATIL